MAALREAFSRLSPEGFRTGIGSGANGGAQRGIELGGFGGFPTGAVLRPIATPLTMAGYSGETKSVLVVRADRPRLRADDGTDDGRWQRQ